LFAVVTCYEVDYGDDCDDWKQKECAPAEFSQVGFSLVINFWVFSIKKV
jgi:hypothetical protein